jgi:hypothetical protein
MIVNDIVVKMFRDVSRQSPRVRHLPRLQISSARSPRPLPGNRFFVCAASGMFAITCGHGAHARLHRLDGFVVWILGNELAAEGLGENGAVGLSHLFCLRIHGFAQPSQGMSVLLS